LSVRKHSGRPRGVFHVQIIKGQRLSNDLANRLNDYKHQFPQREIIAVNVLPPLPGDLRPDLVLYEVVWTAEAGS
jgi:hypothetical protein